MEGPVSAQSRLMVDRTRCVCVCMSHAGVQMPLRGVLCMPVPVPWARRYAAMCVWAACVYTCTSLWAAGTLHMPTCACRFHSGTSSHSSAHKFPSLGRGPGGVRAH